MKLADLINIAIDNVQKKELFNTDIEIIKKSKNKRIIKKIINVTFDKKITITIK